MAAMMRSIAAKTVLGCVVLLMHALTGCGGSPTRVPSSEGQKASPEQSDGKQSSLSVGDLMVAARDGNLSLVRTLIEANVNVNGRTEDGGTALMYAAEGGHAEVVRFLLDANADVDATNMERVTALIFAAQLGHKNVVQLLLNAKADTSIKSHRQGDTALILASQNGHVDVVTLLLDSKADVNAVKSSGGTGLMMAVQNDHKQVVRILLDAKADINARRDNGVTTLMVAAAKGNPDVLKMLLDAGAVVNEKTVAGVTALMVASQGGNKEIVRLLVNAGADINAIAKNGTTALDLALKEKHEDVAQLLRGPATPESSGSVVSSEVPLQFEQKATEVVARAVLNKIAAFYKSGLNFPSGNLTATKEYPVLINWSEAGTGEVSVSTTIESLRVAGKVTLTANKVKLTIRDGNNAANKERINQPEVWVEVSAPMYLFESGKIECSGSFTVNGRKVIIQNGEARITGDDSPVLFSDGAQALIDKNEFIYKNGKWIPRAGVK